MLRRQEVEANIPIDVREKIHFRSFYFSMAITASELLSLNTFIV